MAGVASPAPHQGLSPGLSRWDSLQESIPSVSINQWNKQPQAGSAPSPKTTL